MHVTEKIVDKDGTHILSSTLEADGPFELASPQAALDARVIALRRTASGGVFMQTAVTVTEPVAAVPPAPLSDDDRAVAYFVEQGFSAEDARGLVARFGAARVLARKADAEKAKHAALDDELGSLLEKGPDAPVRDIEIVEPNRPE